MKDMVRPPMKTVYKITAIIVLFSLSFSSKLNLTIDINNMDQLNQGTLANIPYTKVKITSNPIVIENDTDFGLKASQEGWNGYGNSSHPFILENLEIYLTSNDSIGIKISSTTVFFTIQFCNIRGSYYNNSGSIGILLNNVTNANISNNNFNLDGISSAGIWVQNSNNLILDQNYFGGFDFALYSANSSLMTFSNNYIGGNKRGITLLNTNNSLFLSNNFTYNNFGIIANLSNYNSFRNNSISYTDLGGILLYFSSFNSLVENKMWNNKFGILLEEKSQYNSIIANQIKNNVDFGIQLLNSCSYTNISNNILENNGKTGIYAEYSSDLDIVNNLVSHNYIGIELSVVTNSTRIYKNLISNNDFGIFINYTAQINIISNQIEKNQLGIDIWHGSDILIDFNSIFLNSYMAINISFSKYIYIYNSTLDSNFIGILLTSSQYGLITTNIIKNTTSTAIFIPDSSDYQIFYNDFLENNVGFKQVDVYNYNNQWDNGLYGNYWSDHDSYDTNNDGILDEPYLFEGIDPSAFDQYPLALPYNIDIAPVISPINNPTVVIEGENGLNLSWYIMDKDPDYYRVYQNDFLINEGTWNSGDLIVVSLDNLSVGSYNYTLWASDKNGLFNTNSIFVTILDIINPVINNPDDRTIALGSNGNILSWEVLDNNPDYFIVYRNNLLLLDGNWNSDELITISLDNLIAGTYNFTIIVYDISRNWVTDTVIVNVDFADSTNSIIKITSSNGFEFILIFATLMVMSLISIKRRIQ